MSDIPRSLQSWVSTIQTVVLTADVFHFFIKYVVPGYLVCSYVRPRTARRWRSSKKCLATTVVHTSTRKNKSNDLEPHFTTSATKSRCVEDTKTVVALPHCSESTKQSISGWWTLALEVRMESWRNYRTSYVKNRGRGASSRGYIRKIRQNRLFFFVGDATHVVYVYTSTCA